MVLHARQTFSKLRKQYTTHSHLLTQCDSGKRKPGIPVKTQQTPEERELAGKFERLTEATSTLMDAGELDVYSLSREVSLMCTCDGVCSLEAASNPQCIISIMCKMRGESMLEKEGKGAKQI